LQTGATPIVGTILGAAVMALVGFVTDSYPYVDIGGGPLLVSTRDQGGAAVTGGLSGTAGVTGSLSGTMGVTGGLSGTAGVTGVIG
jgi:hypothetical protein